MAVSGGVDSVVLLDSVSVLPEVQVVVAHFDHGIRDNSSEDVGFVEVLANKYGLAFYSEKGDLGRGASEAKAREVRYDFLKRVQENTGARAVLTAHHQDDLIETMILNLVRGTGRLGLHSLGDRPGLLRPLLNYSRSDIEAYASRNDIAWREDSTNADQTILRNYIRHKYVYNLSSELRKQWIDIYKRTAGLSSQIDIALQSLFGDLAHVDHLDRYLFRLLDHASSKEALAVWLRRRAGLEISQSLIERLVVFAKLGQISSVADAKSGWKVSLTEDFIYLTK